MTNHWSPELLAPAGGLDKLKVAVCYGADAVYLAGQHFGLRSAADNFTDTELLEGVAYAHQRGAKVYVVLNSYLHDSELENLPEFLSLLEAASVDAVIVSDLGVVRAVKKYSSLIIHLSTQASCLNVQAARLWKLMGVQRVVLGRELSVWEGGEIKRSAEVEVEMFIHGSMCMAYSGNCVISNYTQGRDSNRGGCAHSCRFEYSLDLSKYDKAKEHSHFMSSKDLNGMSMLGDFIAQKIDSIKVEGRMKSRHYVGSVGRAYAQVLKKYRETGKISADNLQKAMVELEKVSHRDYTTASLQRPAGVESIYSEREHNSNEYVVAGVIQEIVAEVCIVLNVKSAFCPKEVVEVVPFDRDIRLHSLDWITRMSGAPVAKTLPGSLVKIPFISGAEVGNLVRKKVLS